MSKQRILVVDDEAGFARLLKLNLEQTHDYIVQVENSAADALSHAERFQPDLMFLDVMMPNMDGGELAARLSEKPKLKGVPIVFLTAAVKKEEISSHGGQIGGYPFVAKPVDLPQVIACIKKHLRPPADKSP
jgi:CheY-like chemotaxis protein